MSVATKEQRHRDRVREYEARLADARPVLAVLAAIAQAREACGGDALEVGFAAIRAEPDRPGLPAAVWVALRQDDIDAVLDTLVEHAGEQFVVAEHEQLDASYRLTTVAESRGLPDVEALIGQVAAFVDVPRDVVAVICSWGPDDPRTRTEIERLIGSRHSGPAATAGVMRLAMSSEEFAALLSLSPEQRAVLASVVRQAEITVSR